MWCRVTMSRHLSDSHMTLSHIWTFYSADQNSGRGRLLVFNISCIHIFHTKSFGSFGHQMERLRKKVDGGFCSVP